MLAKRVQRIELTATELEVEAYVGRELHSYNHVEELKQCILDQAIGGKSFLALTDEKLRNAGLVALGKREELLGLVNKAKGHEEDITRRVESLSIVSLKAELPHDLDSVCVESVLTFLEGEMIDMCRLNSPDPILSKGTVKFSLVGRDPALDSAARIFKEIIHEPFTDRTRRPVPVCSGLSGLGKTRMLEEGDAILARCGILNNKLSVIVPYFNGHNPQPVETTMSIEASFSWRLLHRVFIEHNGADFKHWFRARLPRNGGGLTLECALEVIHRKLVDLELSEGLSYLFVGIDEYQKIDEVNAFAMNSSTKTSLWELVEVIGSYLHKGRSSGPILLPLFAGTDWKAIDSIANASIYATERLPMTLLTADEVQQSVRNQPELVHLLNHATVERHLFYLGGVPRWTVQYILSLQSELSRTEGDALETMKTIYDSIVLKYVSSCYSTLNDRDLLKLAAYSLSSLPVCTESNDIDGYKWSRLRDSSLCLLIDDRVVVPYALLLRVSQVCTFQNLAEQNFLDVLKRMHKHVDELAYDLQPWQLWEKFGAYFYALRINSLIVLGKTNVSVPQLLFGAIMTDDLDDIEVDLTPTKVFWSSDALTEDTPRCIKRDNNARELIDWTEGKFVVINGFGGIGVDIFFTLPQHGTTNKVLFLDQRKRTHGSFGLSARIVPRSLGTDSVVIRGVVNCLPEVKFTKYQLPSFSFVVGRDQSTQFHGSLSFHPGCSPLVHINIANKTALKMVFKGTDANEFVDVFLLKREQTSGLIDSMEDLEKYITRLGLDVRIEPQSLQFLSFSC